jgi:murein DD-endopeptidase MepM/ murein hydrolase activator NlpD
MISLSGFPKKIVFSLIGINAVLILALLFMRNGGAPDDEFPDMEILPVAYYDAFGIEEDLFEVDSRRVRSGQTLSTILSEFGIGAAAVDRIARQLTDIYNPRRIRTGQPYHGYVTRDSIPVIKHFVLETSMLNYFIIHFDDTVSISQGVKEVHTRSLAVSGVIRSSLWNTLSDQNLSQELAIRLSEILAWEVDFYRIQVGDAFKVIYNENYVDEISAGIERIEAVYFNHRGRDIYGFHFANDTIEGFFHPNGDNLRKVFLKAPLEFGRISSRFSHSRLHPIHRDRRPHYGTDYAAPHGTPILAVGDGVVTEARYTSGNGNYVRIRHNSVYDTQYLHMSRFASGIRPGTQVKQGEVIGYVGSTGLATGPHVCFRFWKNGQQVDHLREDFPSADPLPEAYFPLFEPLRERLMERLDSIPLNGTPLV